MTKYYVITKLRKPINGRKYGAHIEIGAKKAGKSARFFWNKGINVWILPVNLTKKIMPLTDHKLRYYASKYWSKWK